MNSGMKGCMYSYRFVEEALKETESVLLWNPSDTQAFLCVMSGAWVQLVSVEGNSKSSKAKC